MPNILKAPAKVHAAKNFLKSFYDVGGTDHIYIALGDAGGEWGTPSAPDVPIDAFQEEVDFWANMIGMGEISQATNTELVTLRKDWVTGNYVAYDQTADLGTGSFDTGAGRDWYVANNNVNPKVYRCVIGFDTLAVASTIEPDHNNPTGVVESDGYKWEYLYTVGVDVGAALSTVTWLPVPDGTLVGSYSNGMAVTFGQLVMGDGSGNFDTTRIYQCTSQVVLENVANGATLVLDADNTWEEWYGDHLIGAFWVGCQLAFPDYAGTGNEINNVAYRQVALLRNPKDNTGVDPILDARITAQWKGSAFQTPLDTGVVITVDNRVTITRAVGQTETVRLILEF